MPDYVQCGTICTHAGRIDLFCGLEDLSWDGLVSFHWMWFQMEVIPRTPWCHSSRGSSKFIVMCAFWKCMWTVDWNNSASFLAHPSLSNKAGWAFTVNWSGIIRCMYYCIPATAPDFWEESCFTSYWINIRIKFLLSNPASACWGAIRLVTQCSLRHFCTPLIAVVYD